MPASVNMHMQQKHWKALAAKLLAHPRSPIFLDVVFDSIRTIYRMVRQHWMSSLPTCLV